MPAPRPLPDSPDLDQLRRQAKELLRSARAADPTALTRFRVLPSLRQADDDLLAPTSLALHDAQAVIAREHGFRSWNSLRERVEELTLDFDDAVREFMEAATDGRTSRAERMLSLHPRVASASMHTALVMGDTKAVESHLSRQPDLAFAPGGPRGWEPIHYVCHTALGQSKVASADGLVAIARRLLALGVDANTRFPWLHHGVRRPVLWGAIHSTQLRALAEVLLQFGADPNDGVTLPIAASAGDVESLELLRTYGASANQSWATDGSSALYAILQWATTPVGVQWLLEHGADADPVFAANGETPMHVVARRWDVSLAELLAERGADLRRRRSDRRTPYAVAELNGNRAVADWLRTLGAADELEPVDRLVAACGRGDRATAETMLLAHPTLRDEITDAHYAVLHRAAEQGDAAVLALLIDCGFDPNRGDEEMGKTALHSAAMAGRQDAVRLLLSRGASPDVRDREFHGQPLVWAAEGARSHDDGATDSAGVIPSDHAAVGQLLLHAGSPVDWQPGEEPAERILEIIAEWKRGERADHRPPRSG